MALLIGLTGPIGAGKSFVANVWRELGAGVVEGDAMGKLALQVDPELRIKLSKRFGLQILNNDGLIIRHKLAEVAFSSQENQHDLTSLTFPTLYKLACDRMKQLSSDHAVVVFDAALIYEWKVEADFDVMVAITAPRQLLVKRAASRMGISLTDAEQRLSRQITATEKIRKSKYIIVNDKGIDLLRENAESVWQKIIANFFTTQADNA